MRDESSRGLVRPWKQRAVGLQAVLVLVGLTLLASETQANRFTSSRGFLVTSLWHVIEEGDEVLLGRRLRERSAFDLGEWNEDLEERVELEVGEGYGSTRGIVNSSVEGTRFEFHSRLEIETAEFTSPGSTASPDEEARAIREAVDGRGHVSRRAEFEIIVPTTYSIMRKRPFQAVLSS